MSSNISRPNPLIASKTEAFCAFGGSVALVAIVAGAVFASYYAFGSIPSYAGISAGGAGLSTLVTLSIIYGYLRKKRSKKELPSKVQKQSAPISVNQPKPDPAPAAPAHPKSPLPIELPKILSSARVKVIDTKKFGSSSCSSRLTDSLSNGWEIVLPEGLPNQTHTVQQRADYHAISSVIDVICESFGVPKRLNDTPEEILARLQSDLAFTCPFFVDKDKCKNEPQKVLFNLFQILLKIHTETPNYSKIRYELIQTLENAQKSSEYRQAINICGGASYSNEVLEKFQEVLLLQNIGFALFAKNQLFSFAEEAYQAHRLVPEEIQGHFHSNLWKAHYQNGVKECIPSCLQLSSDTDSMPLFLDYCEREKIKVVAFHDKNTPVKEPIGACKDTFYSVELPHDEASSKAFIEKWKGKLPQLEEEYGKIARFVTQHFGSDPDASKLIMDAFLIEYCTIGLGADFFYCYERSDLMATLYHLLLIRQGKEDEPTEKNATLVIAKGIPLIVSGKELDRKKADIFEKTLASLRTKKQEIKSLEIQVNGENLQLKQTLIERSPLITLERFPAEAKTEAEYKKILDVIATEQKQTPFSLPYFIQPFLDAEKSKPGNPLDQFKKDLERQIYMADSKPLQLDLANALKGMDVEIETIVEIEKKYSDPVVFKEELKKSSHITERVSLAHKAIMEKFDQYSTTDIDCETLETKMQIALAEMGSLGIQADNNVIARLARNFPRREHFEIQLKSVLFVDAIKPIMVKYNTCREAAIKKRAEEWFESEEERAKLLSLSQQTLFAPLTEILMRRFSLKDISDPTQILPAIAARVPKTPMQNSCINYFVENGRRMLDVYQPYQIVAGEEKIILYYLMTRTRIDLETGHATVVCSPLLKKDPGDISEYVKRVGTGPLLP